MNTCKCKRCRQCCAVKGTFEEDFADSVFMCNYILFHLFVQRFVHISHVADVMPLAR